MKVSSAKLASIFISPERSSFIWNYENYGLDGNDAFFVNFIDCNITNSRKHKIQDDALELAIRMNYYMPVHLDAIVKIILSRRSDSVKLTALDWLFNFAPKIPLDIYLKVNELCLSTSKDSLLKVQSILNILLVNHLDDNYKRGVETLLNAETQSAFYRFFNGLIDIQAITGLNTMRKNDFRSLIKNSLLLSNAQKQDMLNNLDRLV